MRYLAHTHEDRARMLEVIGAGSVDDLFRDVPDAARLTAPLALPGHRDEIAVEREIAALAAENLNCQDTPSFLGCGAYRHHIPAAVDHLIQRSEFLTSYTPYQPEISQGTLHALFEFQTQVALITGMDVANASMYDGATGTAEAVLMAMRITRKRKAVLSGGLHPHYGDVCRTTTQFIDFAIDALPADIDGAEDIIARIDEETACVVVQTPDVFGRARDLTAIAQAAQAKKALLIAVVTEVVSLGALASPGEMGADIVVAEGQSLGNALNFGGPMLGLFAAREKHVRQMPGRLCGQTVDAEGKRGYVLTLATREQHIRREKATSNICTNAGLCTLAFCIHLALLGEDGFRRLAAQNHARACQTADALAGVPGVELLTESFFNEFTLRLTKPAAEVVSALAKRGVLAGVPASRLFPDQPAAADLLIVAATELTQADDIAALAAGLAEVLA